MLNWIESNFNTYTEFDTEREKNIRYFSWITERETVKSSEIDWFIDKFGNEVEIKAMKSKTESTVWHNTFDWWKQKGLFA